MRNNNSFILNIDWISILTYLILVIIGLFNIYSANYDSTNNELISFDSESGKQLLWFGISLVVIAVIFAMDFKFFNTFTYVIYGLGIVGLILTIFMARDIQGGKSWLEFGPVRFQPSEISKYATALFIAKYFDQLSLSRWDDLLSMKTYLKVFNKFKFPQPYTTLLIIIGVPVYLIYKQHDVGSALVFSSFIIVFYREGLPNFIPLLLLLMVTLFILTLLPQIKLIYLIISVILIGITAIIFIKKSLSNILIAVGVIALSISIIYSVDYFVNDVLEPHQQKRINAFIDAESYKDDAGWNIIKSKTAIAAGGFSGAGFLQGRYTQLNWVYGKSTDFIFATLAEEHGWFGCMVVISLFVFLFIRLTILAERQKSRFARVYGYCVISLLFFHFVVNVGMTIGLAPVIGIPLPFLSYGGSSLLSFTILLFTFLKLDVHRMDILVR